SRFGKGVVTGTPGLPDGAEVATVAPGVWGRAVAGEGVTPLFSGRNNSATRMAATMNKTIRPRPTTRLAVKVCRIALNLVNLFQPPRCAAISPLGSLDYIWN